MLPMLGGHLHQITDEHFWGKSEIIDLLSTAVLVRGHV